MVTDVLDQLQSGEELVRECGCKTLAVLASQPGALPHLLSKNVVRIVAPLVVDPSPCVRHRALGALRNISVDGGFNVCHDMVLKDVLTPLIALFKQYEANWEPEKKETKHTDSRLDTFLQAVHVLWNLCEASDIAVTVFNKEKLLPLLLPCLQHSVYGYPLAIAVAQCLHTVTESNAKAAEICRGDDVLPMLKKLSCITDMSSQALLFKAAVLGILVNVLGGDIISCTGLTTILLPFNKALDIDGPALIVDYAAKKLEQNRVPAAGASGDAQADSHLLVEDDVTPGDKAYRDLVYSLDAQRLCLELITNMCCSPEEEWEEENISDSGSADEMADDAQMDVDGTSDNNNFDLVGEPSDLHCAFMTHDFVKKVVTLTLPLSEELTAIVTTRKWGQVISKKLMRLRTHALLCINNMMETLPLGDQQTVDCLWDTLVQQLKTAGGNGDSAAPVSQQTDPDVMEALTTAMRAVSQKMAQLKSPKLISVTVPDVRFLMKFAEDAPSSVQIHIMRIVTTMASLSLLKVDPHSVIQEVGECLVMAAAHSPDLVVVAEALDCLFDAFADDATDPVAQSLQLTEKLRAILPQLKAKIHSQKKLLGENYVTVTTARTNLIRFIKYKDSQGKG